MRLNKKIRKKIYSIYLYFLFQKRRFVKLKNHNYYIHKIRHPRAIGLASILSLSVVGIIVIKTVLFFTSFAAGDTSTSWDFSVPGDYTLSNSSLVEVSSDSAKLKFREYSEGTANTSALFHFFSSL